MTTEIEPKTNVDHITLRQLQFRCEQLTKERDVARDEARRLEQALLEHDSTSTGAGQTSDEHGARPSLSLPAPSPVDSDQLARIREALGVGEDADLVEAAGGAAVLARQTLKAERARDLNANACDALGKSLDEARAERDALRTEVTELRAARDSDSWHKGWVVAVRERDEARRAAAKSEAEVAELRGRILSSLAIALGVDVLVEAKLRGSRPW